MHFTRFWSLVSLALLSACQASAPVKPNVTVQPQVGDVQKVQAGSGAFDFGAFADWHASGRLANDARETTMIKFACLKKDGDRWTVEHDSRTCPTKSDGYEQIALDYSNKIISLMAHQSSENTSLGTLKQTADGRLLWRCKFDRFGNAQKAFREQYNICSSQLAREENTNSTTMANLVAGAVVLGITYMQDVAIDMDGMRRAAISSGAIESGLRSIVLDAYNRLAGVSTPGDLERFSNTYGVLMAADTTMQRMFAEKRTKVMAVAERRDAEQRKLAEQDIAQKQAKLAAFRKSLKAGDESHCGLVMSVNGAVATVQAPAGIGQYGMRVSDLYPVGLANCQFLNGIYQRPRMPY